MTELPTPTGRELEILKVLWEVGPSSVKAVHRNLARLEPDLAYNTVQTLLRIMDEKRLVEHHVEGLIHSEPVMRNADRPALVEPQGAAVAQLPGAPVEPDILFRLDAVEIL